MGRRGVIDRNGIIEAKKQGLRHADIAAKFSISHSSVDRVLALAGLTRRMKPRVNGKPVDVLTGDETIRDRILDAAWNALSASEKTALIFGACSKQ